MSLTSAFYRLARISADVDAGSRAVKTGSLWPIIRRLANKLWGRKVISKLWWRG